MSDEEREEKELDLTSHEVVTKYKSAAEIVNKALQLVLSECKPLARIVDLCEKCDAFIREQTGSMYKNVKKKIERGVAFPTRISVNNTVCHFYPLASDNSKLMMVGDILKIDMGCHVDGFIAVVAHTHVLQQRPVTGRAADVIAAANTAAEVALRLVRPGKKNKDVSEAIQKVAAAYDCKLVVGLSHQRKQKVVPSASGANTKGDETEFKENEVYIIDIVTSTGEGKPKLLDKKQTKKIAADKSHNKASRSILSEISQNFQNMPSSARAVEEKRARLGVVEWVNHDLLLPLLHEKPGDLVAHIKFTVLLMPNGSDRITSHPLQKLQSTKTVEDPQIKAWLALATNTKKKAGGKKKNEIDDGEETECAALWHVLDELLKYNQEVMLENVDEEDEGDADSGGDERFEGIMCAICLSPEHLINDCPLERGTSSTTVPTVSDDYRVLCRRCGSADFAKCEFKSFQACVWCGSCLLCAVLVRCPYCLECGHLSKKDTDCVLHGKEFTIKNDPLAEVYCAERGRVH